ncbi:MAG: hypothetical protein ABJN42_20995 [Roseibium sp.]|uniref:hypothetical protein n=1 Tax=Roseibium sp. TaxID=1936156 RepID=UPI003298B018
MLPFRKFLSGIFISGCMVSSAWAQDLSYAELIAQGAASQELPEYRDDLKRDLTTWDSGDLIALAAGPARLPKSFKTGVASPLQNSDPNTIKEIVDLLVYQVENRTSKNFATIVLDDQFAGPEVFLMNNLINDRTKNPALWDMLDLVDRDVRWMALRDKAAFERARPFEVDPALQPQIKVDTPSYPSLSAARALAAADILSRLNPVCSAWYEGIARNVGEGRQIAGVNYASDISAAKVLADRVVQGLIAEGHLSEVAARVRDEAMNTRIPFKPCHFMAQQSD